MRLCPGGRLLCRFVKTISEDGLEILRKNAIALFNRKGCTRLSFSGVPAHLLMITAKGGADTSILPQ